MAFSSIDVILTTFGAGFEVVKNVTNETSLAAFNAFVGKCGVSAEDGMSEGQKAKAWKSFVLAESGVVAPQLFGDEPKLTIDELMPTDDGKWQISVSLTDGDSDKKIAMAAEVLKSRVRVGTDVDDINYEPSDVSVVSEGDSVTLKVAPPSGGRGFMRIKVE